MKEIKKIVELYENLKDYKTRSALATVVQVDGSAYRRPGAKMLISESGKWTGTISGGCLEGDALAKAKECIRKQKPVLITYDTRDDSENKIGANLGCNGVIDVLLEPITPKDSVIEIYKRLVESDSYSAIALIFQDSSGELTGKRYLPENADNQEDAEIKNFLKSGLKNAVDKRQSFTDSFTRGERSLQCFFELIPPEIHLIIFGSGFDTYPLIAMADYLGWKISVTSDHYSITFPENFKGADEIKFVDRNEILQHFSFNDRTFCVLMSHNHKYDKSVLKSLIDTNVAYIGVLGPKTRMQKIVADLINEGVVLDEKHLAKIYNPIGLDIGGDTPDEIALSVIAEIQAVMNGKNGMSLKFKSTPIHQ